MELKAKIIAVQTAMEGVVVVIQQDRPTIPIADNAPPSDETIVVRKMMSAMRGAGINIEPMMHSPSDVGFRTGFWMPLEDYEQMGKPSIGDVIVFALKVEK